MSWQPRQPVRMAVGQYLLRSLTPGDVTRGYARFHDDPELHKLVQLPLGFTLEQHQRVVSFANDRERFMLGIFSGSIEQLIGFCKINIEPRHQRAHFTLVLGDARSRNQGIAQALWPALHRFMFRDLQLHKVSYEVRAGNAAALHLLHKHGAVQEVLYEQHERTANGAFSDVHGFGLLRREWLARQGDPPNGADALTARAERESGAAAAAGAVSNATLQHALETEHYRVQSANEEAVRAWYDAWLRDEELMRFTGIDPQRSLQEHLQWLNSFDGKRAFLFSVLSKQSERHIGLCLLRCDLLNARAMPTVVLGDRAHWGQGHAYEVLAAVYDFAFDTLGMNKINSLIWGANERALRAIQKKGRVLEGILRQHEWVEGVGWQDVHVFRLLHSEWKSP